MSNQVPRFYLFGPYHLDTRERLLFQGKESVPLTPKLYDLLLILIEHRGQVLEKDKLLDLVWPDTLVEEGTLTRAVSSLRSILREGDNEDQYLETIPRRGYRFVAEVKVAAAEENLSFPPSADPIAGQRPATTEEQATPAAAPANAPGRKSGALWAAAGGAVLLATSAVLFRFDPAFNLIRPGESSTDPRSQIQITRLTESGEAQVAAISPDGKYVAYALRQSELRSIWIKQVETNSQVQIVPPAQAFYPDLAFSRDGDLLYFLKTDPVRATNVLYQVPFLGGPVKELISGINSTITLSPDGEQVAFVRDHPNRGEDVLIVAGIDGSGERELARRKHPSSFLTYRGGPSWSPDGRIIACPAVDVGNGISCRLVGVRVADGAEEQISAQRWFFVGKVAWMPDNSGLVITVGDRFAGNQLWHLSYPGGAARRVTNDAGSYFSVNLAGNASRLVAIQTVYLTGIWVTTEPGTGQTKQLLASKDDISQGLFWTPDGRIVFAARAGENQELWSMNPDGNDLRTLVAEGVNHFPYVSHDGRYLIFSSIRAGKCNVWRQDLATGSLKRITDGDWDIRAQSSPDGKWIVYDTFGSSTPALWKAPIDGGPAAQLTDKPASAPAISPDGRLIACNYLDESASRWRIALLPFAGGQPIKSFDTPTVNGRTLRWSPDGRTVTYIEARGGVSNIWSQPIDGGEPGQLTSFNAGAISMFAWSHDGRQLAIQRSQESNDVVLIRNFPNRPGN